MTEPIKEFNVKNDESGNSFCKSSFRPEVATEMNNQIFRNVEGYKTPEERIAKWQSFWKAYEQRNNIS